MIARLRRAGLFRAVPGVAIGALIFVGAGVVPSTLFSDDKAAKNAVEVAVEKAVAKAAEKVAEKAAEEATEKAELTARRPDEWRGPTEVHFLVFVLDVDEIDDASQSFATNVFIQLR